MVTIARTDLHSPSRDVSQLKSSDNPLSSLVAGPVVYHKKHEMKVEFVITLDNAQAVSPSAQPLEMPDVITTSPIHRLDHSALEVEEKTPPFDAGTMLKSELDKEEKMFSTKNEDVHDDKSDPHSTDLELGVNAAKTDVTISEAGSLLEALRVLHIGGAGVQNVANDCNEADVKVRLKNAHISMADGAVIEMHSSETDIANRSKKAEASLEVGPINVRLEENSKLQISSNIMVGNDADESSKINLKSEGLDITLKQQAEVEMTQALNIANESTCANVDIENGHQSLEFEEGAKAKLEGGIDGFSTTLQQLNQKPTYEANSTVVSKGHSSKKNIVQRLEAEEEKIEVTMADLEAMIVGILEKIGDYRDETEINHMITRQLLEQTVESLETEKENLEVKMKKLETDNNKIISQLEEEKCQKEANIKKIRQLEEERGQLTVKHADELWEERKKVSRFASILEHKVNLLFDVLGQVTDGRLPQDLARLINDLNIRHLSQECGLQLQEEMADQQQTTGLYINEANRQEGTLSIDTS